MSEHLDNEKKVPPKGTLTKTARARLRASMVAERIGDELKDDLQQNTWKLLPALTPFPSFGLWLVAIGLLTGSSLVAKVKSQEFRDSFREACKAPIDLKRFEKQLKTCRKTGMKSVRFGSLMIRHKNQVLGHMHHIVAVKIDGLRNEKVQKALRKIHNTIAGHKGLRIYRELELGIVETQKTNNLLSMTFAHNINRQVKKTDLTPHPNAPRFTDEEHIHIHHHPSEPH